MKRKRAPDHTVWGPRTMVSAPQGRGAHGETLGVKLIPQHCVNGRRHLSVPPTHSYVRHYRGLMETKRLTHRNDTGIRDNW